MYSLILSNIFKFSSVHVPATGIGLFRLFYGLVTLQEIIFLLYFNHLIFDPIPYIDVEFPMIPFFLSVWAVCAFSLVIGYRCQLSAGCCYLFWIIFVQFTPMQRDFDGGFDLFMTGANFFLLFMPMDKAFALDGLRYKLQNPLVHYSKYPPSRVTVLAYYIPITICLGFLYFDSAIHKMFAEHWRNGLGSWLPATQPYYISAINMSFLLNNEILQKTIGYLILIFQFTFIFLVHCNYLRPWFLCVGLGMHLGIVLTLNIYPFGFGMLIFYTLVIPFSWWRKIGKLFTAKEPTLTIFFDEKCPLCNRTVLIINHFDVFKGLDFKGLQTYGRRYSILDQYTDDTLLNDLYAVDSKNTVSHGVKAYSEMLIKMRYLYFIGVLLKMPIIFQIASKKYRQIADSRLRVSCDQLCEKKQSHSETWYTQLDKLHRDKPKQFANKLTKVVVVLCLFQLNSSIHYGIFYRFNINTRTTMIGNLLTELSNSTLLISQMFFGITPHALYLHDHFQGYNHILAITYLDQKGIEQWLPFVNQEGRLVAPNWGRVHSMWANIAVTPHINETRLSKLTMKVTAFWGKQCDLDLNKTTFIIKLKKIESPTTWVYDLRNKNLQGDWETIGKATWKNNFQIFLPSNISDL